MIKRPEDMTGSELLNIFESQCALRASMTGAWWTKEIRSAEEYLIALKLELRRRLNRFEGLTIHDKDMMS